MITLGAHPLMTAALLTGVAAAVTAAATFWVRRFALERGLFDAATSSRKIHTQPVPRLGGLAMTVGLAAAVGFGLAINDVLRRALLDSWQTSVVLALSTAAIIGVGIVDDLRGVRARTKLLVQLVAAVSLSIVGRGIESIEVIPGLSFGLGFLGPVVTVLWIVGVINALNLIDGMDGLAGGVALISSLAMAGLALANGDLAGAVIPLAIAGVTFGFLAFNWHPASIFMGDTGSMLLGLLLALSALRATATTSAPTPLLVCVLLLSVPILDTTLAVVRRLLLGRSPFSADRDHLHHRILARFGIGQRGAVLVIYSLAAAFGLLGLGLTQASKAGAILLLAAAAGLLCLVLWRLGYLRAAAIQAATRRRNAHLRAQVREVSRRIARARDLDELLPAVQPLAEALAVARLELHLDQWAVEPIVFHRLRPSGSSAPLMVHVPLKVAGTIRGKLVGVWRDGRSSVDRDHELALERVAGEFERALPLLGRRRPSPTLGAALGLLSREDPFPDRAKASGS